MHRYVINIYVINTYAILTVLTPSGCADHVVTDELVSFSQSIGKSRYRGGARAIRLDHRAAMAGVVGDFESVQKLLQIWRWGSSPRTVR
ncbi:hypothetical protein [Nocardia sp. NPDC049149]|uniref:hypothetical protein n=1 Tax=Nocardia sp. NPDC049149 TaxID=3364315 RepID=UPI00371FF637